MKIFKVKDMKEVQKQGFILKYLAEISLKDNVSSVGFFRPDVPPNGKLRNHYHNKITEFMLFLNEAKIKAGSEIHEVFPGDLVMFPPGENHEVLAGPDGTMPIVIKLPNDPEDTQVP